MNEQDITVERTEDGPNVVVRGKKVATGETVKEDIAEEPKTLEMNIDPVKISLRELIERSLTATMESNMKVTRRDRGKGRPGNGSHPSLLNLHRDIGTDLSSRWLSEDDE